MAEDSTASSGELLEQLGASRERFLAFVRRQIDDPQLAEDILQSSLLKAVEGVGSLGHEEKLVPWFYRILRNAVIDAYRSRGTQRYVGLALAEDLAQKDDDDAVRRLCLCFEPLLPALKAEYREVIRLLDLEGRPTDAVASELGISPTNLKVRRHRARAALRSLLQETCRVCAQHHCLDCTCRDEESAGAKV